MKKWPTGKYNGKKIGGFIIKIEINLLWWAWKPRIYFKYNSSIHFLCFHIWIETAYEK